MADKRPMFRIRLTTRETGPETKTQPEIFDVSGYAFDGTHTMLGMQWGDGMSQRWKWVRIAAYENIDIEPNEHGM